MFKIENYKLENKLNDILLPSTNYKIDDTSYYIPVELKNINDIIDYIENGGIIFMIIKSYYKNYIVRFNVLYDLFEQEDNTIHLKNIMQQSSELETINMFDLKYNEARADMIEHNDFIAYTIYHLRIKLASDIVKKDSNNIFVRFLYKPRQIFVMNKSTIDGMIDKPLVATDIDSNTKQFTFSDVTYNVQHYTFNKKDFI